MGLFKLHNRSLHVWVLNSFTYTIISKPLHITSMKTMKAKVSFVTLHLPLLPLSMRNHRQTCFIYFGSEHAAVSPESPPGQLFQPFELKHWWDIFYWSPFMLLHLDGDSSEQYGGDPPEPCLSDHILDSPSFTASRQRPRLKLIKTPVVAPSLLFSTNTGR